MAQSVYQFSCTIPHATPSSAPATIPMIFPPNTVRQINVRVPPGPNGNVGFVIGQQGLAVVPDNTGAWIITSDEALKFPLTGVPDNGQWQLIGYNTGSFDHTIYVTFLVDVNNASSANAPATVAPLSGTEVLGSG